MTLATQQDVSPCFITWCRQRSISLCSIITPHRQRIRPLYKRDAEKFYRSTLVKHSYKMAQEHGVWRLLGLTSGSRRHSQGYGSRIWRQQVVCKVGFLSSCYGGYYVSLVAILKNGRNKLDAKSNTKQCFNPFM